MPVDLAVATPTFLDLTLVGLEALPQLGEERFAGDLLRSPGGGAITAVGAARLGLSVALASPLGDDLAGALIREVLAAEGVSVVGRQCPRTPITVVMPVGDDRAMVTVDPGVRSSAGDVVALTPRAVSANLDQLYVVPEGAVAYATCGDDDARAFAGRPPGELSRVRTLFVSQREALALTEAASLDAAADRLAQSAETVVVTLGAGGALTVGEGRRIAIDAPDTGPPVDTTGAIDLLVAAFAWADLHGSPLEDAAQWAVLYASLSITTPTGVGGAASEARLLEEGARRGLSAPPRADASVS